MKSVRRRSYIGCLPGGRYLASDGGWSECRRVIGRVNWCDALSRNHMFASPKRDAYESQDKDKLGPLTLSQRTGRKGL
jgi:hypothetical protein